MEIIPEITQLPTTCPCESGKEYAACCQPFHLHDKLPSTPEALMRSRYTAYAIKNYLYIKETMCGKASENVDIAVVEENLAGCEWKQLEVLNAPPVLANKSTGKVEFKAIYHHNDDEYYLHEISQFEKIEGKWFYVDGELKTEKETDE